VPNKPTKWAIVASLAIALLVVAYTYRRYRIAPRLTFPNLEVMDALGAKTVLRPQPGRSLVVVFFASWCHDCARELPKLHAAWSKNLKQVDVALITDEGMTTMLEYRALHKYPFAFYTLPQSFDNYGIHAIPTTYLLNAKGEIVFSKVGEVDWNSPELARKIDAGNYAAETVGVKMIPIQTPVGEFKVWTKRFGNNPKIKILLLHGGPALTHEYMECFEKFFLNEGFEFYQYDQLGSYFSDRPKNDSLWQVSRFVEEVEQVRQAIGADGKNFYLLGNSWGGILAMEYALKYQKNLKGLMISNMMASAPAYGRYANEVLAKQMDPKVLSEIRAIEAKKDFENPRYMELLLPHFYHKHICRLKEWPDGLKRAMDHVNGAIYTLMQGPSEFGIGGRLANWDVKNRLKEIIVPTLMIGAKYDTMDPKAMEEQSRLVKNGRFLFCPDGSHLSMWDDQQIFMRGVIRFIKDVDSGLFS
jgi:proline iminopeptidase